MPLPKWQVPLHWYTGITVCTGIGKWLHTLHSYSALGEPEGFSWGTVTNCTLKASISGTFNESTLSYNKCKSQQNCSGYYVTEFKLYTVWSKCFESLTPKHTKLFFFSFLSTDFYGTTQTLCPLWGQPPFSQQWTDGWRWTMKTVCLSLSLVGAGVFRSVEETLYSTLSDMPAPKSKTE